MPTTLTNGIQLPDKGSVDWYSSMQSNYNLIDTHLGDTDVHVTAEDKANWNSKQGSLSQDQLDAIAQVATNTSDIATLQSDKADASHTHSSSDITDIDDYATKDYVDNSISGLVDNAPDALNTLNELSAALNDDSNFASTVTTALAAKADSADLATVATSGDYDDLSNKPTIPTKTSDLTNDSNFVDTSNSAVASGITSSKVTDYDTHIADTDIHVTTADKNKWNAVTSKANDSDVVHKSGDESIGGIKSFSNDTYIKSLNFTNEVASPSSSSSAVMPIITTITYGDSSPSRSARLNFRITADGTKSLYPHENNQYALGLQSRKWSEVRAIQYYYGSSDTEFSDKFVTTDTNQTISGNKTFSSINGVEPSSLSLPDLSNGIDISSYIDVNQTSQYTAPTDGYISICGRASATNTILLKDRDYDFGITARAMLMGQNTFITYLIIPVVKNHVYDIICNAVTSLDYAKFYPCQGNV